MTYNLKSYIRFIYILITYVKAQSDNNKNNNIKNREIFNLIQL